MQALARIVDGWKLALRSPGLLLLLWLSYVAAAVPATLAIRGALEDSLATSLTAEKMRRGFDTDWYFGFRQEAQGIETTFSPAISGPAAVLGPLDVWLSGDLSRVPPQLVGLGIVFLTFQLWMTGGVIDRLGRARERLRLDLFGAACGRYFLRFTGLFVLSAVVYYWVYRLARWWFLKADRPGPGREEMPIFVALVLAALSVALLLNVVRMVFDYAKIATVLDERRNIVGSLLSGLRIVFRHPLRALGIYFTFGLAGVLLLALYVVTAPGAEVSTVTGTVLAFLYGQAYLTAQLMLRMAWLGAQLSHYRATSAEHREAQRVPVEGGSDEFLDT